MDFLAVLCNRHFEETLTYSAQAPIPFWTFSNRQTTGSSSHVKQPPLSHAKPQRAQRGTKARCHLATGQRDLSFSGIYCCRKANMLFKPFLADLAALHENSLFSSSLRTLRLGVRPISRFFSFEQSLLNLMALREKRVSQ